jgi:MoaA/NifB/PqqE/SkfB family radical SAM enzyme
VSYIVSGEDISSQPLAKALMRLEHQIATDPDFDKIGAHREIGKAIFSRSPELYNGQELPEHLKRYTYPAFLSIALSSHCNAACFFCRDTDYKGRTVDWDDLAKLGSAIRHARSIDLTGWGEPFFYPRFEEFLEHIASINPSSQLITVTTNGSFLSEKWGRVLRGKVNRLVISINAGSERTYEDQMRYKNKRFTLSETIHNIKAFQAELTEEDRKRLMLHMVANTGNFREISAVTHLAADLKIPQVSVGNFICADEAHLDKTLWTVKEEYNAELARAMELGLGVGVIVSGRKFFTNENEVAGAEKCVAPFEQCFVEMPGSVAPCCFMGQARMGNVYDEGFEAIWFGDLFTKLRRARYLPACQVCTVFTPFDDPIAHMSAFLTTKDVVHETPTSLTLMTSRKSSKEPRPTAH